MLWPENRLSISKIEVQIKKERARYVQSSKSKHVVNLGDYSPSERETKYVSDLDQDKGY